MALFLLFSLFLNAQRWKMTRYEIVGGIGAANVLSDLGGANQDGTHLFRDLEFITTKSCFFIGGRYKIYERFAVKLNVILGYVKGDDALSQSSRTSRKLSFTTSILETSSQFEYSLIKEKLGSRYMYTKKYGFIKININTYLFAGVGGFYFNPKSKCDGVEIPLESYQRYQLTMPVGVGLKYKLKDRTSVGIDCGIRYTSTDYIDNHKDVNSNARDAYMFIIFNVSYKFLTSIRGLPKF